MSRILLFLALWCWGAAQVVAGPDPARLIASESRFAQSAAGHVDITLHLDRAVPYRVFVVDNPPRLVVDFEDLAVAGGLPEGVQPTGGNIGAVRLGVLVPGWARMVADLRKPMVPQVIELRTETAQDGAILRVKLAPAQAAEFAAQAGAPDGVDWAPETLSIAPQDVTPGQFTVVLDPGHGGIDPGAERDGLVEKDLVLDVARALRARLTDAGARVVMTREEDRFVSLSARTALAHRAQGHVFLSIHADALNEGDAHGATVYTLSERASDAASAQLAARHNRSDILAGLDLSGADDDITRVLLDLARQETEPRSEHLAQAVIARLSDAGGPMNSTPWRRAGFSVLKSADIPSVLVEIGFLSSARDRENLADPEWRAGIAAALARAVLDWRDADAARIRLLQQ